MSPKDEPGDDPVYSQPQASPPSSTFKIKDLSSRLSKSPNPPDELSQTPQLDSILSTTTPSPSSNTIPQPIQLSSVTASSRLRQLSSHLSRSPNPPDSLSGGVEDTTISNTKRARRRRKPSEALPPDYSDILTHITTMKSVANTPKPSDRGYARQKAAGKLWARERIAKLLDPGSWMEIGSFAGTTTWKADSTNPRSEHVDTFTPSNNPQGLGTLLTPTNQRRQIFLTSDDFSIRSGHADGSNGLRTLYLEKLALKLRIPVIKLVDGSSGGGSVTTIRSNGYAYLPHVHILATVTKQLNEGIPNLAAIVGPAIGLGAARAVSTHFSVMAADVGSLFNAGPKVVEGATGEEGLSLADLGGPNVHCVNGTIDNLARDEEGCFQQLRTVLAYLPDCGNLLPPPAIDCVDASDREDVGLRSIIPRRKERMYNPYKIIESVVDRGSWFEIGGLWGRTAIGGLARLGGRPVGVLSNNCEVNGGALDAGGSQKLMKMIKFCDVFNLPIVQFVDVPGYAIGTVAERTATMKWGVALATTYYTSTTPIFSVITRRCYGVAGGVMLDSRDPLMRVAWPSANWGSLPLDGGIEVAHRHELNEIEKTGGKEAKARRYKELEDEYLRLMNPVRTANAFNIEEIIDPKNTRKIVCRWTEQMYGLVMQERLSDRVAGRIKPMFT